MRSLFERTLLIWGVFVKIAVFPTQRLVQETKDRGQRVYRIGRLVIILTAAQAQQRVVKPAAQLVKNELAMLNTAEKAAAYILNLLFFFGVDLGLKWWLHPGFPEKLLVTILAYLVGVAAEVVFWNRRRPQQERLWLKLRERMGGAISFAVVYTALETLFPPIFAAQYKLYSAVAHFSSRAVEEWLKSKKRQK